MQKENSKAHFTNLPPKKERRVAFHVLNPFHKEILQSIASNFKFTLLSDSIEKIKEWSPDVIVIADHHAQEFRKYCDEHNVCLIGLNHGFVSKNYLRQPVDRKTV